MDFLLQLAPESRKYIFRLSFFTVGYGIQELYLDKLFPSFHYETQKKIVLRFEKSSFFTFHIISIKPNASELVLVFDLVADSFWNPSLQTNLILNIALYSVAHTCGMSSSHTLAMVITCPWSSVRESISIPGLRTPAPSLEAPPLARYTKQRQAIRSGRQATAGCECSRQKVWVHGEVYVCLEFPLGLSSQWKCGGLFLSFPSPHHCDDVGLFIISLISQKLLSQFLALSPGSEITRPRLLFHFKERFIIGGFLAYVRILCCFI